jgi:transcriptional regulator with XRE-family HTH domain
MRKMIYTAEQRALIRALREVRVAAGLRQADLAARLGQHQSFVSKYEAGERRVDFLEVRDICEAVGIGVVEFLAAFERLLEEEAS